MKKLFFCLSLNIVILSLFGCNSGAVENSANNNIAIHNVRNSIGDITQKLGLSIDDLNTPVEYRDSLENIPVGNFGLKRILVTNNLSDTLSNLQLQTNLPPNTSYDDTRTTCSLDNKQVLAPNESCMLVLKYFPQNSSESGTFDFSVQATSADSIIYKSNIKNIPYSSRIGAIPKIKFSQDKIITIGGMNESISLMYTGQPLRAPLVVELTTNGLELSKNQCVFDAGINNCDLTFTAPRNSHDNFSIQATTSNIQIDDLKIQVNPINCNLIDNVKDSPYQLPNGFMLRAGECIMVTNSSHEFVTILRMTNNYIPELSWISWDIKNDPNLDEPYWMPLIGRGFDDYLVSINKNALDLCTSQPYYNSKMIGIPDAPVLKFSRLQHGINKGALSLFEDSTAYLGANLYIWDSLTYTKNAPIDNKLVITTMDDGFSDMQLIDNTNQAVIWSMGYIFNFNTQQLAKGNELCQFYQNWQ